MIIKPNEFYIDHTPIHPDKNHNPTFGRPERIVIGFAFVVAMAPIVLIHSTYLALWLAIAWPLACIKRFAKFIADMFDYAGTVTIGID